MKLLRSMCLFMAIFSTGTIVHAQTIAELAHQERDRKQALPNPTVITNVSVVSASRGTVSITGVTATAEEESKSGEPAESTDHGEKYWRAKFDAARHDLQVADVNLKLLDLKVGKLRLNLAKGADTKEVEAAEKAQDDGRLTLQEAQRGLSDLEEELRQSGGPPGWGRP